MLKTPNGKFANDFVFLTSWVQKLMTVNGWNVKPEGVLEAIAKGLENDIADTYEQAASTLRNECRKFEPRYQPSFAASRAALGFRIRNEILDCMDRIKAIREEGK